MTEARPAPSISLLRSPVEDPLALRIAAGDLSAIAEAYDLHHSAIRGFSRRLVGDDAAAEDLVHEVFITLPSAAKSFRMGATLRTFLISIAVNHARHHVRAAQRRRAALSRLGDEPRHEPPSQEDHVARKRLAAALSRALDRLPVDQRVAFVLCAVEERSASEAAEIVGAPEATVRTRLFHAKKKLRELLSFEGLDST